jgi:hypothetical protein
MPLLFAMTVSPAEEAISRSCIHLALRYQHLRQMQDRSASGATRARRTKIWRKELPGQEQSLRHTYTSLNEFRNFRELLSTGPPVFNRSRTFGSPASFEVGASACEKNACNKTCNAMEEISTLTRVPRDSSDEIYEYYSSRSMDSALSTKRRRIALSFATTSVQNRYGVTDIRCERLAYSKRGPAVFWNVARSRHF